MHRHAIADHLLLIPIANILFFFSLVLLRQSYNIAADKFLLLVLAILLSTETQWRR
jgi:hypothetical protein